MNKKTLLIATISLPLVGLACSDDTSTSGDTLAATETGDMGDGDGDPATATESESDSGDGDGDTTDSGDGDGDPTDSGDGDGDGPLCGDGVVDDGEECDDGNPVNEDECTNECVLNVCGDGILWEGMEECDDGNEDDSDACVAGCVAATCDDGFLYVGSETDVDCGGETCEPCEVGQACLVAGDCVSDFCDDENICALDILSATVTVTNEGDVELTDWQVPIDLTDMNFAYADALADGADLRASSDGINADLSYWIENWTANGDSRVWVKVPAIPANGSVDIYLTYGDAMLMDASDGDATFELFDNHEDDDWTDKWSENGGGLVEGMGAMTVTGNSNWAYAGSLTTFDYEIEVHADLLAEGQSSGLIIADDDTDLRYTFRRSGDNTGVTWDPDVSGGNSYEDSTYPGVPFTEDQVRRVTCAFRLSGNQIEILDYCDSGNCNETSRVLNQSPFSGMRVGISNYNMSFGPISSELFFVTKHTTANVFATVN